MLEIIKSNDIMNHCIINGHFACQHFDIEKSFDKLVEFLKAKAIKIDTIIEIGTHKGGFTMFLDNHSISENAKVYSFDIDDSIGQKHISSKLTRTQLFKENVFETDTVKNLISGSKNNCILFCDGGDKIEEVKWFEKYLKKNDIIFSHDFSLNRETFESEIKGKVWDYFESSHDDFKDIFKEKNIKPLLHDHFLNVAWGSYIKH